MTSEEIRLWCETVLEPVLRGEPVDEMEARQAGGLALLSGDADKIKDYVFESAKLPEIRGGSQILEDLNSKGISKVFRSLGLPDTFIDDEQSPGCIAYMAGGGLLAVVPSKMADKLCEDIEELYPKETGAATISCVYQELPLDRDFGEGMRLQGLLLRRRKQEKEARPFFDTLPVMRRCESCGIRPAQEIEEWPELRHLCWVCHKKAERGRGRKGKKKWTDKFEGFLKRDADAPETRQYLAGLAIKELQQVEGAHDIGEIAAASRRGRYVGFIYADGNGIGRQIEHSRSLQEYRQKSRMLLKEMRLAVYDALRRHLRIHRDVERETDGAKKKVDIHPFEIITIGGDDVLLIVPGDVALLIALDICQTFERELTQSGLFDKPAMSAGVVIADANNPVYFMRDLSEQLLKSAKQRSAEERCGSTVDFLVLKSQSMLDCSLKSARGRPPLQWYDNSNEIRRLTARPLTLEEARRLIRTTQVLQREGFSRGQLIELRQMLRLGRPEATLHYLYQWVRYPERLRQTFAWIEQHWAFQPLEAPPPWLQKRKNDVKVYQTFWEDIADLWDFVPELPDEEWEELEREIHPSQGEDNGD